MNSVSYYRILHLPTYASVWCKCSCVANSALLWKGPRGLALVHIMAAFLLSSTVESRWRSRTDNIYFKERVGSQTQWLLKRLKMGDFDRRIPTTKTYSQWRLQTLPNIKIEQLCVWVSNMHDQNESGSQHTHTPASTPTYLFERTLIVSLESFDFRLSKNIINGFTFPVEWRVRTTWLHLGTNRAIVFRLPLFGIQEDVFHQ